LLNDARIIASAICPAPIKWTLPWLLLLIQKIFAVANAKALAFERRVGNVKHQFSQLVRRALAENKLVTANCACVRAISSLR
jgi:hypothetical protein